MKKVFGLLLGFIFSLCIVSSVEAKTIQVSALEDFQTNNPPQVLHIQMNANTRLDYDLMLFQGFQVTGKVVPKNNGGFVFIPVSYVNFQEESLPINKEFQAVYKGKNGLIRQNQPFTLIFPDNEPDNFQYYVPSVSDMN